MNQKKERPTFLIEKKLATIEWNIELLKASAEITHTPLRTLKSLIQASVIAPTHNRLREIADSPLPQKERLVKAWQLISRGM